MKRIVKRIGVVLGLLAVLGVFEGQAQETGLAVGTRAPAVAVRDLEGKTVDLGQYLGKQPLFLEWWATWCEQCDALLPRVRAARAELGDRVQFLGINVAVNQSPARVRRYVESNDVPQLLQGPCGTRVRRDIDARASRRLPCSITTKT